MSQDGTIFVVDDDAGVLKLLRTMLERQGLVVEAFESAERFLSGFRDQGPSCLLLDLRLPGMGGLDVLRELRERGHEIPIIILTAYGNVRSAVESMKLGAVDFIEKPFDHATLVHRTVELLATDKARRAEQSSLDEVRGRFANLTERERELLRALMRGQSSKQIAADWGISTRTVEKHRSNLLAKTGAGNVAELVRLGSMAGLE